MKLSTITPNDIIMAMAIFNKYTPVQIVSPPGDGIMAVQCLIVWQEDIQQLKQLGWRYQEPYWTFPLTSAAEDKDKNTTTAGLNVYVIDAYIPIRYQPEPDYRRSELVVILAENRMQAVAYFREHYMATDVDIDKLDACVRKVQPKAGVMLTVPYKENIKLYFTPAQSLYDLMTDTIKES